MSALTLADIFQAKKRIAPFVHQTPVVESSLLNELLGHRILFKAECLQKVGAFKARGACNAIVSKIEKNEKPSEIIASSSGNHAQAVAWAAKKFNIPATIYMPKTVSKVKRAATESYGAHAVLCEDRFEADRRVKEHAAQSSQVYWIPPYDHDDVISGQGTACLETLMAYPQIDAIAAPCGGGGLLSGSFIAAKGLNPAIQMIGVEPENAADAYQSVQQGSVVKLEKPPLTLADGAATLSISERTLHYLQQLDHFVLANETQIAYWTQWLQHLLKLQIEPTCAMTMVGVVSWLRKQSQPKTVGVIISGGNLDNDKRLAIHQHDYLAQMPSLHEAICG
jgi:threonine dehydratase